MTALLQIAGLIGVPAIVSGAVILWLTRRLHRRDCQSAAGRQETVLILKGLLTIGGLAGATARALMEGQANGAVSTALEDYSQYKEALGAFLVEQASQHKN